MGREFSVHWLSYCTCSFVVKRLVSGDLLGLLAHCDHSWVDNQLYYTSRVSVYATYGISMCVYIQGSHIILNVHMFYLNKVINDMLLSVHYR